ncbi:MAG: phosphatase PAP2 family protein [Nitrospirae bacterium]|nr:phosphatase PAP2 family protein [Nitrospirota bacterium]
MKNSSLREAEKINLFFLLFFFVLALVHIRELQSYKIIYEYLILLSLQLIFIKIKVTERRFGILYDVAFPVISVLLVFDSMSELVHVVNPHDIDYRLIQMDYKLFGLYPTVYLERFVNPFLTEILQLSYSSYYFLPVVLGVVLKVQGRDEEFNRGLAMILLCFYLSYVGYIIFPALGPRYTMLHLQSVELQGVYFFKKISSILNSIEGIKRDAFPSGHTAITLLVLHLAYKFERRLFYIYLPVAALLLLSTVYCRYHYVVDVIGGIGLYLLTVVISRFLLFRKDA